MSSDEPFDLDLGWVDDLAVTLDKSMESTLESLEQIADAFASTSASPVVVPPRRRADPKSRARAKRAKQARRRNRRR